MRVCSSCGRENPDDRDFCECGEYLRWDPTGVVQAVTPEVLQAAQDQAPPAGRRAARRARSSRPSRAAAAAPAAATAARRAAAGRAPRGPPGRAAGAREPRQRRRRPARPRARRSRRRAAAAAAGGRSRRAAAGDARAARAPPPAGRAGAARRARSRPRSRCACPEGEQGQPGETLDAGRRAGRPRPRARARAQPERDRRQLRAVSARTAGRLVVDLPEHRLPRAVRHQRHLRAGGGDPPPPAAHARGRGADLGARGRRRVEGLQQAGRRGAAAARDPPVRGVQDQALARARVRPQEGATSTSRSTTRPTAR